MNEEPKPKLVDVLRRQAASQYLETGKVDPTLSDKIEELEPSPLTTSDIDKMSVSELEYVVRVAGEDIPKIKDPSTRKIIEGRRDRAKARLSSM